MTFYRSGGSAAVPDDEPRLDSCAIVTDDYLVEEVDAGHDDRRAVTDIEGQNDEWPSRCKEVV